MASLILAPLKTWSLQALGDFQEFLGFEEACRYLQLDGLELGSRRSYISSEAGRLETFMARRRRWIISKMAPSITGA